ncbi:UbiA prenyltransferase family protein [Roseibium sp. RKSG952]|uniref:UbiA prenyltransferase family protein n=1 Tax=Roseibium sp. RKSG952 TaxID=2529384 RepID=UPI0012BBC56F|nr:UbiA prenyltransferase family protein [Roseibium sp. RKSG952]MTH98445.1 prenyltransferase [Roseibium sp. RKSG952]
MKKAGFRDYVSLARIDHWFKNIFILPGAILAWIMGAQVDAGILVNLLIGIFSICLIASANYTINEWLDREFDRHHPLKKERASVVTDVDGRIVFLQWAGLSVVGLVLAYSINFPFFLTALALLIMGVIYNVKPIRSKDRAYLDVLSEAINNPIRFFAGWYILVPPIVAPSSVLISYWFGGAYLMAIKRFAEYRTIDDPSRAALYRASFKNYDESKLLVSAVVYAILSTAFLGVFLTKYKVELLLSLPFVAMLFGRYLFVGLAKDSIAQAPENLYKQKGLVAQVLILVVVMFVLLQIKLPFLEEMLEIKAVGT